MSKADFIKHRIAAHANSIAGHFETSTLRKQEPGKLLDDTEDGEMTYQPGLLVFSGGTAFNNIAGKTPPVIKDRQGTCIDTMLGYCTTGTKHQAADHKEASQVNLLDICISDKQLVHCRAAAELDNQDCPRAPCVR